MGTKIYKLDDPHLLFCPGCNKVHAFDTRWTFNGNYELPTFMPSLVIGNGTQQVCHSFVKEGTIHFLEDSHHNLAGATVGIPDWEEHYL